MKQPLLLVLALLCASTTSWAQEPLSPEEEKIFQEKVDRLRQDITDYQKQAKQQEKVDGIADRLFVALEAEEYKQAEYLLDEWSVLDPQDKRVPVLRKLVRQLGRESDPVKKTDLYFQFSNVLLGELEQELSNLNTQLEATVEVVEQTNQEIRQMIGGDLNTAAAEGDLTTVQALVEQGEDINNVGGVFGTTPLILAVEGEHLPVVQYLIEQGADVNLAGELGMTPLLAAAGDGNATLVRLLLKAGAEVNVQAVTGVSPLSLATSRKDVTVIALLEAAGATLPETAIEPEASKQEASKASVETDQETLPATAADASVPAAAPVVAEPVQPKAPELSERQKETLQDMSNKALIDAVLDENLQEVSRTLDVGANVNYQGITGMTPLMYAQTTGNVALMRLLVEQGADVDIKDNSGDTALFYAASQGRLETVQFLLDQKSDPNIPGVLNTSPLMTAASHGHTLVVRALVEGGADLEIKNVAEQTALALAVKNGHVATVKYLLKSGADAQSQGLFGQTIKSLAQENGHDEIVQLLEANGA